MPAYDPMSLISDKQCLIIDIGTKYTKFGFSGEPNPRCILPTEAVSGDTGKSVPVFEYKSNDELRSNLIDFVHMLFFKYALIHPKEKRVVIVESLLCPTIIKNTLASVLFDHFEVASVIFLPSHVVSLYTLGVSTGLVVDIGYNEVIVIPVYEGIPILKAWQALPLGSKSVELALRERLSGKVKQVNNEGEEVPDTGFYLTDSVIEDIKVKGCFVTKLDRARLISEGKTLDVKPPGFLYRINGDKVVYIDSDDREVPYEVLFEEDADQVSLSTIILDSILQCTMDMRKKLAENIILVGGTAMAKGLKARIKEELLALIKQHRYENKLFIQVFKFHKPPALENYVSWLGGSICGATDMISMKSLTRENYTDSNNNVPDWSNLVHRADIPPQKTMLQI